MSIKHFVIIRCRETVVLYDLVVEMSRVLGGPRPIGVGEVHMVQSETNFVPINPLKGIHERCSYVSFHLDAVNVVGWC